MTTSLRDHAYHFIRHRLLTGYLTPGSRLSELAVSREMGTSRGPVREAINQLVSEGLLQQVPNAGVFVTKPTRSDLEDLYQLREWLEGETAAEAARRINEPTLADLRQLCDEMGTIAREFRDSGEPYLPVELLSRIVTADLAFHMTLIRACANQRVMKVISEQQVISHVWCFLPERHTLRTVAFIYREHTQVMRAVARRDAEAARECMRRHIVVGCQKALERFDWRQRQLAAGCAAEPAWPAALQDTLRRMEQSAGANWSDQDPTP